MVSYAPSLRTGSIAQKRVVPFHSQLAEKKAGIKPYLKKFLYAQQSLQYATSPYVLINIPNVSLNY
jgi:hypothetical protein